MSLAAMNARGGHWRSYEKVGGREGKAAAEISVVEEVKERVVGEKLLDDIYRQLHSSGPVLYFKRCRRGFLSTSDDTYIVYLSTKTQPLELPTSQTLPFLEVCYEKGFRRRIIHLRKPCSGTIVMSLVPEVCSKEPLPDAFRIYSQGRLIARVHQTAFVDDEEEDFLPTFALFAMKHRIPARQSRSDSFLTTRSAGFRSVPGSFREGGGPVGGSKDSESGRGWGDWVTNVAVRKKLGFGLGGREGRESMIDGDDDELECALSEYRQYNSCRYIQGNHVEGEREECKCQSTNGERFETDDDESDKSLWRDYSSSPEGHQLKNVYNNGLREGYDGKESKDERKLQWGGTKSWTLTGGWRERVSLLAEIKPQSEGLKGSSVVFKRVESGGDRQEWVAQSLQTTKREDRLWSLNMNTPYAVDPLSLILLTFHLRNRSKDFSQTASR